MHRADMSQEGNGRGIARVESKGRRVGEKNHKQSTATAIVVHLQQGLHIWEETACG